tara:strand:+ start:1012 stop:1680 length:669 start_codon:yes stop_codon:yes gene_type:complete
MLLPLRSGELQRLIPSVATGNQFRDALGNPRKILQRIMISSIGGVITLLISQSQVASQFYSLWLVIGVVFLLYILWGPIVEAGRINSRLRKYNYSALFDGFVTDVYLREKIENRHEQANKIGDLEIVENRRTWMFIELEDEDGYLGCISFPMEKNHRSIRKGLNIRCLVFSNNVDFNKISDFSDAWIPSQRIWVGEYPYLLRPAFMELCHYRLREGRSEHPV